MKEKIDYIMGYYKTKILHVDNFRSMDKYIYKHLKGKLNGVEIGVRFGKHAIDMLYHLNINKLFLVDPYLEYEGYPEKLFKLNLVKKFLEYAKNDKRLVLINKKSEDAFKEIPNNLDFVYIDGNHEYPYVKKDINLYYPKVKIGGLLGGHDYSIDNLGVIKAVDEFVKHYDYKLYTNKKQSDWWIIKK